MDVDSVMKNIITQLIIDFVEIECAYMQMLLHEEHPFPLWYRIVRKIPVVRGFLNVRNKELGLKYIELHLTDKLEDYDNKKYRKPWRDLLEVYNFFIELEPEVDYDAGDLWDQMVQRDKKIQKMLLKAVKLRMTHGLWT